MGRASAILGWLAFIAGLLSSPLATGLFLTLWWTPFPLAAFAIAIGTRTYRDPEQRQLASWGFWMSGLACLLVAVPWIAFFLFPR